MNKTIEALAEKEFPDDPYYQQEIDCMRKGFIKGYETKELQLKEGLADREIYVPVSVEEELPPNNTAVSCLHEDIPMGEFTFLGVNSWNEAILDHNITHWLKKTTLKELGVVPISEVKELLKKQRELCRIEAKEYLQFDHTGVHSGEGQMAILNAPEPELLEGVEKENCEASNPAD